ncbi:MAG: 4-hydroxy-tetrahydrodipicolinate reductase [Clostridia bacterium]|nr:4-hydroxy-tetrahydrodipicolinate reductase [Clostridia bacterium]
MNILVIGCNGHMGQIVSKLAKEGKDFNVVAGYDRAIGEGNSFPVFDNIEKLKDFLNTNTVDVIIDFSLPEATMAILKEIATRYKIPMVIATTNITADQQKEIEEASNQIKIFKSANMSYEIKILEDVLRMVAPKLAEYDIEIVEEHHNRKVDAPSGTAKTLANAINESLGGDREIVKEYYGKRDKKQIGVHSVRGGNIVGVHTIKFIGMSDELEITHRAQSRDMFAEGALKAAKWLVENKNKSGLYNMNDLD